MDLFAPVVGGLTGWKRRLNDGNDSSISMDAAWRGGYLR